MIVSGAAPPMVDVLRRVRRCMSRRPFCRFCHPRSRVPIVLGPFHYCAFCERATPDAPETIDDQRRSTGCRYRTIYGGSRGTRPYQRSLCQDAEIRLLNCSFLLRLCAFCELRRTFLTSGVLWRLCAGARSTRFRTCGAGRAPARSASARPMIVSGAAPPMVDVLRRVRRCMSRRPSCRFCHPRSRVPIVLGPFHYCAFCERATPDAPETIDDQRRSTGFRHRTIYGGSRGSTSLPTLSVPGCRNPAPELFFFRRLCAFCELRPGVFNIGRPVAALRGTAIDALSHLWRGRDALPRDPRQHVR